MGKKYLIFIDYTYSGLASPHISMTMMIVICTNWLRKLRAKRKYFKVKLPCTTMHVPLELSNTLTPTLGNP